MRFLAASVGTICALCLLPSSGQPAAAGNADIAALQVALRAADAYVGPVDGWRGPETDEALLAFQQRAGPRARRHRRPPHAPRARTISGGRSSGRARSPTVRAAGTSPSSSSSSPGTAFRRGRSTAPSAHAWRPPCAASSVSPTCRGSASPGREPSRPCGHARPTSPLDLSRPVDGELGDGFGPRGGVVPRRPRLRRLRPARL